MEDFYEPIDMSQQQKASLARAGEVNLSGREISSFKQLEIPEITTVLNLSNNFIADFSGFQPELRLDTLILDDNPLVTFRFLPEVHNIRHFSAVRSPLTMLPNFRILAILAFGDHLETINGKPVTANEKAAVSGQKLAEFFKRQVVTKISNTESQQVKQKMANAIRKGWISDTFPKSLASAEQESDDAESDPISVLAVRLFTLVHADDETVLLFFKHHMAPTHKITIEPPRVDDKLEQQQTLITFMQDQLNELKKDHADQVSRLQKASTYKSKAQMAEELKDLSKETLEAYNNLIFSVGPDLVENSRQIAEEEKKKGTKDMKGLRSVVAKILGVEPNIGDRKLARMLKQLGEDALQE
ncbi:hypothetical protein TRFO_11032 [Tritrichomonas foetus]|uniref:Leucine Rich Repeat family protein n=1 Tax=Tritrichomonas foetus TaxID=1144522 RepID=A0A1J4J604_9EUKA|nr:hypothetical protein TRFO_11032 [Tritrichomonas foetus]|eukprot:OHS94640.1 hypothetical protein TRFO_11032 [Tritrichomonas foetus]